MTHKERLFAVFRGTHPDLMPWFADLTYWYNAAASRGTLPERYKDDGLVQLYRYAQLARSGGRKGRMGD